MRKPLYFAEHRKYVGADAWHYRRQFAAQQYAAVSDFLFLHRAARRFSAEELDRF